MQFHRTGSYGRRASHQTNRQTQYNTERLINRAKQIVKVAALSLTSALDHSKIPHCIYIEICLELVRHEFESKGKRGKLCDCGLLLLVLLVRRNRTRFYVWWMREMTTSSRYSAQKYLLT